MSDFDEIQSLLQERADCNARINLIPYDGSPEIKENASGKYLYIRKRIGSRLTSTYVDVYSDELYQLLLRNAKELKELRKKIRHIDKKLADQTTSKSSTKSIRRLFPMWISAPAGVKPKRKSVRCSGRLYNFKFFCMDFN